MTLPVQTPRHIFNYSGPGVYKPDFIAADKTNIICRHIKEDSTIVTLDYGTDYIVDMDPYEYPTVTILYDEAPYAGRLLIKRDTPLNQLTDWLNQGPFDQELLEQNLDKLTMIVQDTVFYFASTEQAEWRGPWQPNTFYDEKDMITGPAGTPEALNIYMCVATHQSSDDFSDDYNAGYWQLTIYMGYLYDIVLRAEQAAAEAITAKDDAVYAKDEAVAAADESRGFRDDAEQFAIQAGTYVGEASQFADLAYRWADNPVDVPVENGEYSSYHWAQKSAEYGGINELDTTDNDMLLFQTDPGNPKHRTLLINKDMPSGIPKLDYNGRVKREQLPTALIYFIGPYRGDNTCPKPGDEEGDCVDPDYRNPSQRWPGVDFPDGAYFIISSDGDIELMDGSGTPTVTAVELGDALLYVKDGLVLPDGWYHVPGNQINTIIAAQVVFDDNPTTIKGTNVQSWNQAADVEITNRVKKTGDIMSGALIVSNPNPYIMLEDNAESGAAKGWKFDGGGRSLGLYYINEDNTDWVRVFNANTSSVSFAAIPIIDSVLSPTEERHLTPKKYVDDNFLDKRTGGSVNGEVQATAFRITEDNYPTLRLILKNPSTDYVKALIYYNPGGGFIIDKRNEDESVRTHIFNHETSSNLTTIPHELRLPANVGTTNPKLPL